MSTESVCRICVENAKTYESLYDSNGQKSDVYLLVVKYFDETLINFEKAQHLKGICVNCLQKIQYFDHFQKSVIRAQEKLEDHKEVKRENTLTGYDEELSLFHINDKSKHDLPVKENNLSNQCNNDAVCVRPEEIEHIKVPKLEIVDAFSGDGSTQSNHERFLDWVPSPYILYTGLSVSADDRNQNIDQNENSSIEKSDETNPVNKLKTEIRSPEDIDTNIPKLLPGVEGPCVRSEENKQIDVVKLEIVDVFSGDESIQSYNEEFLDSKHNANTVPSGFSVSYFSDDSKQNIDQNDSNSIEKSDETIHVNKVKNKMGPKRSAEDFDKYIAKILASVECGMCKKKQPTFTHLVQHFKSEHPAKVCYAMCCGYRFKWRSNLASHVKCVHSGPNAYSCKYCKKPFLSRRSLLVHMRTHNPIQSKVAPKTSPKDIDNNIAKLLHSVECGMCKEMLPTYTHLVQHFKSKHPGKECCAVCCEKRFKRRYRLARHVQSVHAGLNDYTCKLCNKSFEFGKSLALHMRVHKPMKRKLASKKSPEDIDDFISKLLPSIQCGMCKEKLPTFTHLAQHFKSEHPEKECCAMCCGKTFKSHCNLESHVSSSHSALKMDAAIAQLRPSLECVVCKETCSTYSLVQYHFESKHPFDEFYIMCCNRKLKDRPKLLEHLQFHENPNDFKCDVCNKPFAQRQYLLCHMRKYHPTSNIGVPKHINDPIKTSAFVNDAACVCPEKIKHIEVPKIEIVDVFSGDESIQSNHEEFLDSTLSAHSVHSGCSVSSFSDGNNQNIDHYDSSSSIEKADATIYLNEVKKKMAPKRSAEDFDKYIAKILPSVECSICKEKQSTFTHLVQHFKSEHPAKVCYAMCCGYRFKQRSNLASHLKCVHSDPNAYSCKYCQKPFLSRRSLIVHMRTHNPIKSKISPKRSAEDIDNNIAKILPSVECGICKEKLTTFTRLLQHFKSEHPTTECYTMCCGKRFKWRSKLARHVYYLHSYPNSYS